MLKNRLLLGLSVAIGIFAACEKPEVYDESAHMETDEALIKEWAATRADVKLTRDDSGLYYQILAAGEGSGPAEPTDTMTVEYEGRFLTDTAFSSATADNPYVFLRENAIPAWKTGLALIKQGGQIRLVIPSPLAYRDHPVGEVPANSVLHFTIDLIKVAKKVDK